jgi:hypothetical protein
LAAIDQNAFESLQWALANADALPNDIAPRVHVRFGWPCVGICVWHGYYRLAVVMEAAAMRPSETVRPPPAAVQTGIADSGPQILQWGWGLEESNDRGASGCWRG